MPGLCWGGSATLGASLPGPMRDLRADFGGMGSAADATRRSVWLKQGGMHCTSTPAEQHGNGMAEILDQCQESGSRDEIACSAVQEPLHSKGLSLMDKGNVSVPGLCLAGSGPSAFNSLAPPMRDLRADLGAAALGAAMLFLSGSSSMLRMLFPGARDLSAKLLSPAAAHSIWRLGSHACGTAML